jgi:phage-related baseplate assembly protein
MTQIDLSQYPSPSVLEKLSFEEIFSEIKTHFLDQFPTSETEAASKGVPAREKVDLLFEIEGNLINKILQAYAYHAIQMRARVNDAAKATMLAYAIGPDLDNLAAFYMVTRKEGETDPELRERLILAVDGFSTAGPIGAYKFHGLSADDDVKDIGVESPVPGQVLITVLGRDGNGTPTQQVLDAVDAALNHDDVRPLTDLVVVQPPTIEEYQVIAKIWCFPNVDSETVRQTATETAQSYVQQSHRLGRDITDSGLKAALHQTGVQRVEVLSPALPLVKGPSEAAFCTDVTVTFEGTDA